MAHPREYTLALVAYVQVRLLALSDFRYDGKTPDSGVSFLFIGFYLKVSTGTQAKAEGFCGWHTVPPCRSEASALSPLTRFLAKLTKNLNFLIFY